MFLKIDASKTFKKREKEEGKGEREGERERERERERGSVASLVIRGKLFGRSISRRCLCETRKPGRAPLAKTTTKTKATTTTMSSTASCFLDRVGHRENKFFVGGSDLVSIDKNTNRRRSTCVSCLFAREKGETKRQKRRPRFARDRNALIDEPRLRETRNVLVRV